MSNIIRNEIVGVNMKLIMSWIELCSRFSPRDVCCTVHWSRLMLLTIHWASVPRQTVISPSMSVCLSVFSTLWGWESTIPMPFISHKKIRQFRKSVFCLIRSFQINQLHLIASLYLVIPTRFLLFDLFLVIRIYTRYLCTKWYILGILSVGSIYLSKSYFAKCPELAILCTNWNESLIPLLTKKPMFYQTYLYIWMCGAIWNYILDSLRILHALQVPNVGDAVHSPQLSGDRRHVCLLLHRQCGVQRTVWLPYPGQALPVLLKVSWSTHRHLTVYIHVYFSYYKKIYPYLKKKTNVFTCR